MTSPNLFETEEPLSYSAVWACNVYALVPYLGILFLPIAFGLGWFNLVRARRDRQPKEIRVAIKALVASFFLLAGQLSLWALLYIIPEIGI